MASLVADPQCYLDNGSWPLCTGPFKTLGANRLRSRESRESCRRWRIHSNLQNLDRLLIQHLRERTLLSSSLTRLGPISAPRHRSLLHLDNPSHGGGGEECTRTQSSTYSEDYLLAVTGSSIRVQSLTTTTGSKFRWTLQNREPCRGEGVLMFVCWSQALFADTPWKRLSEWGLQVEVRCAARVRCRKNSPQLLQGFRTAH
jgi:hypothetical protein